MVRFDGAAVELERMVEPIRHWGPGGGTWHDDRAGLGTLVDERTPGTGGAPIVLRNGSVVAAAGRLDNAEELARELGCGIEDATILAAAWERWGDDAPR